MYILLDGIYVYAIRWYICIYYWMVYMTIFFGIGACPLFVIYQEYIHGLYHEYIHGIYEDMYILFLYIPTKRAGTSAPTKVLGPDTPVTVVPTPPLPIILALALILNKLLQQHTEVDFVSVAVSVQGYGNSQYRYTHIQRRHTKVDCISVAVRMQGYGNSQYRYTHIYRRHDSYSHIEET
jgi:hypothetical protein